ncbi:MAG: 2,3-bisphosphoglycerate-independent phosphoglycerate mutase [Candidatus Midichloria sp.]|nr:MAG: 2,3-bisphosphoglycerate-independent phosphoglycerate mutase [Candidatus Midichloria sp.]
MSEYLGPMVLCILDGWGHSNQYEHNAIAQAKLPFFTHALKTRPISLLDASGTAVGLSAEQMGNSEVGHMTIGSGRVIIQDLERINVAIATGEFASNRVIKNTIEYLKLNNKTCHLVGLASDGGVHSHINHFLECGKLMRNQNIDVCIHIITDGRDTAPKSAAKYISAFIDQGFKIASVSGRFYAMDRDKRFERTKEYYKVLVKAEAKKFSDPFAIIEDYKSDEFIEPHVATDYSGMNDKDCVFMINFRADRVQQIMLSLLDTTFQDFQTKNLNLKGVGMTSYSNKIEAFMDVVFPRQLIRNTLGEVIAKNNLKQLRMAETEKYAHVTYFFNGGQEKPYNQEDRIIVPSPKILTYDLYPEMAAYVLTEKLIEKIRQKEYSFICINFANADMVGHTANMAATIKACETIDLCLTKISKAIEEQNGDIFVTADHGNAEQLFDSTTNQSHTAHTINKVPLIYFGNKNIRLKDGQLKDIAPTVLNVMKIEVPKEMTGVSLIIDG